MRLADAVQSEAAHVKRAVMFIDMSGSSDMKQRQAETAWVNTLAIFYELIAQTIRRWRGDIIKYTGDGAMVVFDELSATDAINAAIQLQEEIRERNEGRRIDFACKIGIAAGEVIRFGDDGRGDDGNESTGDGPEDYVGSVVDRAARLCEAASPWAIFIDKNTVHAAMMLQVRCKAGDVSFPKWGPDDYLGSMQTLPARGVGDIDYHEIMWSGTRYGVKSQELSDAVRMQRGQEGSRVSEQEPHPQQPREAWHSGVVSRWDDDKTWGFITDSAGEGFYCDARFTVSGQNLTRGATVYFVLIDPLPNRKARVASCAVAVGEVVAGKVIGVAGKHFAFLTVTDATAHAHDVYMWIGDNALGLRNGEEVRFRAVQGPKGPKAEEVVRPEASIAS